MRLSEFPVWGGRLARVAAVTAFLPILMLLCVTGTETLQWNPVGGSSTPPEQGAPTLPVRVGAPAVWTADAAAAPIGAASVLYTSNSWFQEGADWLAGLVGRSDDTYRVAKWVGSAGMASVLSADGARIAYHGGIADLSTGRVTGWGPWSEGLTLDPQAWSPDGAAVAVLTSRWDDTGVNDGKTKLYLFDVATGTPREIAELNQVDVLAGWEAAFSPDGGRLAYQNGARLSIFTLADGTTAEVPLPAGARLAGKGAWTRDGRNLLVVSGAQCDCGAYPIRWTVTTISAVDGTATGTAYTRDGVLALRVLGWWPSGEPVAVEYSPTASTQPSVLDTPDSQNALVYQWAVEAAQLINLGTGTRLMGGDSFGVTGDIESIDVADDVLARGESRPGSPPLFDLDGLVLALFATTVLSLLVLIGLGVWRLTAGSMQRH
jgi:hypothetical protein